MNIAYCIELHTYWHCGSGLSRGADVDALVIKDSDALPFIPGKTMKGLIREAVEDYIVLSCKGGLEDLFIQTFGTTDKRCDTFFSNATLPREDRTCILSDGTSEFLYKSIARTALDEKGVAKGLSLRKTEVTVPCTLEGMIYNVPKDMAPHIEKAFGMIKRLGVNRNRGLGRCTITKKEGGNL